MAANENYITRTDLGNVTQKVLIENSKALADPLLKEQKKGALRQLEENAEAKQRHLQLISTITNIVPEILKGLFSFSKLLVKAPKSIFKFLWSLLKTFIAFAGLVKIFDIAVGSFVAIGRKLRLLGKFFDWLTGGRLGKSKFGKFLVSRIQAIQKWFRDTYRLLKAFSIKKLRAAGRGVFSIFERISKFFSTMVKWARKYNSFFRGLRTILKWVFFPITIIMGIYGAVKGFMQGYSEAGLMGGLKGAVKGVFEVLYGGIIDILLWIPKKIAEWLGFENTAAAIGKFGSDFAKGFTGIFDGVIELVFSIFRLDGNGIMESLKLIWDSVLLLIQAPFQILLGIVQDTFKTTWAEIKQQLVNLQLTIFGLFDKVIDGIKGAINAIPPGIRAMMTIDDTWDDGLNEMQKASKERMKKLGDEWWKLEQVINPESAKRKNEEVLNEALGEVAEMLKENSKMLKESAEISKNPGAYYQNHYKEKVIHNVPYSAREGGWGHKVSEMFFGGGGFRGQLQKALNSWGTQK